MQPSPAPHNDGWETKSPQEVSDFDSCSFGLIRCHFVPFITTSLAVMQPDEIEKMAVLLDFSLNAQEVRLFPWVYHFINFLPNRTFKNQIDL